MCTKLYVGIRKSCDEHNRYLCNILKLHFPNQPIFTEKGYHIYVPMIFNVGQLHMCYKYCIENQSINYEQCTSLTGNQIYFM